MKPGLVLEAVSPERLARYAAGLLLVGTYYRRLYRFAFNEALDDQFHSRGLVYEVSIIIGVVFSVTLNDSPCLSVRPYVIAISETIRAVMLKLGKFMCFVNCIQK